MKVQQYIWAIILSTGFAAPALAVPKLQLDILGGTYDVTTQTVIAPSDVFTLYGYATPKGNFSSQDILNDKFYLSVALLPQTVPADNPAIGSFEIDSVMYDLTDMVFGVPPVETLGGDQGHDAKDLSQHGIFETYFLELEFMFNANDTSGEYNTEINTGQGPIAGSDMFYREFDVDVTQLTSAFGLHFDLYTIEVDKNNATDLDVGISAPFSHDAETGGDRPPSPPEPGPIPGIVPEPTSVMLSLLGLTALSLSTRRRRG